MIDATTQLINQHQQQYSLYFCKISAGFPSPADDYIEAKLDLNDLLIKHPSATFFVRVNGNSMLDSGIHDKDILIIDRSLTPAQGKIVIAAIDGQLTVKRIKTIKNKTYLISENKNFSPIEITPDHEMYIWGVVTTVIHPV